MKKYYLDLPIICKKLCELAILCVLLRHLNNKGSSEHIITGLQFLSAMSLSKKVADKARAVIEELDEESLNENADSKKSRFFKVGKVGQIFSGIKWG